MANVTPENQKMLPCRHHDANKRNYFPYVIMIRGNQTQHMPQNKNQASGMRETCLISLFCVCGDQKRLTNSYIEGKKSEG